jgi:hypothetical protein
VHLLVRSLAHVLVYSRHNPTLAGISHVTGRKLYTIILPGQDLLFTKDNLIVILCSGCSQSELGESYVSGFTKKRKLKQPHAAFHYSAFAGGKGYVKCRSERKQNEVKRLDGPHVNSMPCYRCVKRPSFMDVCSMCVAAHLNPSQPIVTARGYHGLEAQSPRILHTSP